MFFCGRCARLGLLKPSRGHGQHSQASPRYRSPWLPGVVLWGLEICTQTREASSEAEQLRRFCGLVEQLFHLFLFVSSHIFESGRMLYPKGNLGSFQVIKGIVLASSPWDLCWAGHRVLFCCVRCVLIGEPSKCFLQSSASNVHVSLNCPH